MNVQTPNNSGVSTRKGGEAPTVDGLVGGELNALSSEVLAVCRARGWSLHWTHRGAYLHLEASELIEAVRGKRGTVLGEAGDVLLVLMSITENAGIPFTDVLSQAWETVEQLKTKPHLPEKNGNKLLRCL